MTVKTDAKKSVGEPSLFDLFGPNVSEQVKVLNQRAAELSMGDMARVMNQAGSTVKKSWEPEVDTVGQTIGLTSLEEFMLDNRQQVLCTQRIKPGITVYDPAAQYFLHSQACEVNRGKLLSKGLSQKYLRVHAVPSMKPALIAGLNRGTMQVHEAMEQAWSNMTHLLDMGVDGRSVTVTIKYNDPKTEVPRSLALDADVSLRVGSGNFAHFHDSMEVKSGRSRGSRKHGHARALQYVTAKK